MCSAQDRMGFMWFGTRDGLNRFDGYSFKVYRFNSPGIAGSNFIHALHVDQRGNLWVGTEKEIYRYYASRDSFGLVTVLNNHSIKEITSDKQGNLWMIVAWSLVKYSTNEKKLQTYANPELSSVTGVLAGNDGKIWVSTTNGKLVQFDENNNICTEFDLFTHSVPTAPKWVESIQFSGSGQILVGFRKGSLKTFDPKSGIYKDVSLSGKGKEDLFIRTFIETGKGITWIGTETGIYIYNEKENKSTYLHSEGNDHFSISDNVIYTFCQDSEGGIWVGTYFGGLNYYPHPYTPFEKYYTRVNENSLNGNVVRDMLKDQYGNLWIGTTDAGLNKLDAVTGRFHAYQATGRKGNISHNNINTLLLRGNELWIGNFEHGLDILNIKSGDVVRHYDRSNNSSLRSNYFYCLYETSDGEVLAGTTIGLYTYSQRQDQFIPLPGFPIDNWYTCVQKDVNGTIWTGVYGKGIFYYDTRSGKHGYLSYDPLNENSIGSNIINAIFEDKDKNLWFATENGLCKRRAGTQSFKRYTTANGFPINFIASILEDGKGKLWIGTTKGLVVFDPQTEKVQTLTVANGLLSDQLNIKSAYKDITGKMYFGGSNGYVALYPSAFATSNFVPPLYLTGLRINNQDNNIFTGGEPLGTSIVAKEKITLQHNQSTFSIDFAALSYTAPDMLEYAYYLEGLSTNWTYLHKNHKIYFNNLRPGNYILRLKATNSSGIWQPERQKLDITILPPWWQSQLAYIGYASLGILLAFLLIRNYHKRTEEKHKRKIERIEIEKEKHILQFEIAKEKESIQSKVAFFTNVAHEIRTPLTLIKIPLARVIRKTRDNPEVEHSLKIIQRNAERLVELTNQLLDFRETEIGAFKLSFVWENISELVSNAYQSFTSLAEQADLRFALRLPADELFAYIDADAFSKIVYNLCSNAVKYADSNVEIALIPPQKNENKFSIVVKNDGFIIPAELSKKIFEPFYRLPETEKQKGTGIGLTLAQSLAELHNGELILGEPENQHNIFVLTLPIYQPGERNVDKAHQTALDSKKTTIQ
jgi:ligand-binding sensor domain-containing protein/signal transduction histidine kinase